MRVSTIQNLFAIMDRIDILKASNGKTGDILDAESTLAMLAKTARERIIKHAIQSLFDSRIGVNAAFVRTYVKIR